MRSIKCVGCGEEFEPNPLRPAHKYCTLECGNRHRARRYYQEHKAELNARKYRRKRLYIQNVVTGGCKHCGNTDRRVLLFHHRNPDQKEFTISGAERQTWKTLKAEIKKCDVLCWNCHIIVHSEMGNRQRALSLGVAFASRAGQPSKTRDGLTGSAHESAIEERRSGPSSLANETARSGDPVTVAGACLIRPKQHEADLSVESNRLAKVLR